ncbi:ABC transporter substrate-binding protein [Thermodesulfobacteriota bacterium]
MPKRKIILVVIALLVLAMPPYTMASERLTLILDWFPNVDHLPLYVAKQQGFFKDSGLEIKIISPSDTSDALKLAATNKADLAISYEPQTIIAAARGLDITVIGRLVEHPLTTLLFLEGHGIDTPSDLEGKRIGYTVPGLMDVLLEAFARLNGIENYQAINVGFNIVASLTAGKVDAVMGPFKTFETVTMRRKGYAVGYFELEKHGIPDYDELLFVCGPESRKKKAMAISAFRAAVAQAIRYARANPDQALEDYFKQVPEADRQIETEAFHLTLPYFAHSQQHNPERWQTFADFALQYGLIDRPVDVKKILQIQ